ncbi:hypothetical protein PRZ48_013507 [Zasmidium cellare]|uniref:Uncharacterized protein n=1 Tax=Zasmidium cellare TaxID=395010 RepID=A0ABR0E188_ZASCE|nr:hypothetical protein PRZ48_013507 [Zasmidium cellare]
METTPARRYKCAVVGNGAIGKTCLVKAMTGNAAANLREYMPTGRCEVHTTTITIGETQSTIEFWDTPGLEYEHFKGLPNYIDVEEELAKAYVLADVVILCFSIADPQSLRDVKDKVLLLNIDTLKLDLQGTVQWCSDLQRHRPGTPIVLVGTKMHLRDNPRMREELGISQVPTNFEEGRKMAQDVGAVVYLECSAKTGEGVTDIWDAVVRALG